jgi:hypothetical protein
MLQVCCMEPVGRRRNACQSESRRASIWLMADRSSSSDGNRYPRVRREAPACREPYLRPGYSVRRHPWRARGRTGKRRGGGSGDRVDDLPNGKFRFAAVYGAGAVLGFTPQQVQAMSIWQFMAAIDGYAKAHDPESGKGLTKAEEDDLWAWVQAAR